MPRLTQISCLPHLLLVAWLSFLGWAVWQHVERTEQPPIYDALSYAEKARAFWANLKRDKPINPFNLEPTVRPPGTVLLSYPFGFTQAPLAAISIARYLFPYSCWLLPSISSVSPQTCLMPDART